MKKLEQSERGSHGKGHIGGSEPSTVENVGVV